LKEPFGYTAVRQRIYKVMRRLGYIDKQSQLLPRPQPPTWGETNTPEPDLTPDPWAPAIAELSAGRASFTNAEIETHLQGAGLLEGSLGTAENRRIARIARRAGFEKTQQMIDGVQRRVWKRRDT
jgi:hypothetical protein